MTTKPSLIKGRDFRTGMRQSFQGSSRSYFRFNDRDQADCIDIQDYSLYAVLYNTMSRLQAALRTVLQPLKIMIDAVLSSNHCQLDSYHIEPASTRSIARSLFSLLNIQLIKAETNADNKELMTE